MKERYRNEYISLFGKKIVHLLQENGGILGRLTYQIASFSDFDIMHGLKKTKEEKEDLKKQRLDSTAMYFNIGNGLLKKNEEKG